MIERDGLDEVSAIEVCLLEHLNPGEWQRYAITDRLSAIRADLLELEHFRAKFREFVERMDSAIASFAGDDEDEPPESTEIPG